MNVLRRSLVMENVEIIDNFLTEYQFKQLSSIILSSTFPWYGVNGIVNEDDGLHQFIHAFYKSASIDPYPGQERKSDHFSSIGAFQHKLGVRNLLKAKVNLRPKTFFRQLTPYHVDITNGPSAQKTAVFYLNTCNGYTKFRKGGKVKSVANRVVIFPSHMEHAGASCTDKNFRIVINFNYE